MKRLLLAPTLVLAGMLSAQAADEPRGNFVINGELKSQLLVGKDTHSINGRISAYLHATKADLDHGVVVVRALNVVYFGVPQPAITGRETRGKQTGVLGFMVDKDIKEQLLLYDPESRTLSGELLGQVDMPQFDELFGDRQNEKDDDFPIPTQDAMLSVKIQLDEKVDLFAGEDSVETYKGSAQIDLDAFALPELKIRDYGIVAERFPVELEISWIRFLEAAKRLCLQPVRVGTLQVIGSSPPLISVNFSGDGLPFGLPGAHKEWAKADVVFQVRDWLTVWQPQYSTLTGAEAAGLRATVDVDDCIEVFFVDQFSPNAMWGGGATWGGGTASSKIISSDENAAHGIDLTHLAHELGHVITLKHPGQGFPNAGAPHRVDGSSGTLMCPSGFMNDNPAVNSQWNKDNVNNPLFTFALKFVSAGPDCNHDPDCGACF